MEDTNLLQYPLVLYFQPELRSHEEYHKNERERIKIPNKELMRMIQKIDEDYPEDKG